MDLPKYLINGSGTKLVPIVSSARAASIISTKWKQNYNYLPDAFVVEGPKAGGHLGFKADELNDTENRLENLVPQVLEVTNDIRKKYKKAIPVIAAGGIYSGNDIFQILKRGASAVQLGTRFIATEQCDASPEFKKAFTIAKNDDIKIIKSPVGLPGRTIFNQFLLDANEGNKRPSSCKYNCIKTCDSKSTLYCIANALLEAYRGNLEAGFAFAGSNAGMVHKISTVKSVFNELISDYKRTKHEE
jgi:nitronate monooxygenase